MDIFSLKHDGFANKYCTFAIPRRLKQKTMKFIAIIPARYASTRFPGKPLALLGGKPVIQRVYEQVTREIPEAWVATDDERIKEAVESFGGKAIMTSPNHKSGTDRIQEAYTKIGKPFDVVINIQGDEPFIHESQIETVCRCFDDDNTMIATLGRPFNDSHTFADLENPNSPKVVCDNRGFAMYFSRSVIPYLRGTDKTEWLSSFPYLKHIGLYAYRTRVLQEITALPQSPLEVAESLEQLRWLQNGYRIKVGITQIETVGIDTPEDLERAERLLLEREA